jgi:lysozyme
VTTYRVIDISHWNGNISFNLVKASGIWGVIIKAGGSDAGLYTDPRFEEHYNAAVSAGLHVGAYYFVGKKCVTAADGTADANRFMTMLKGKKFDLPVYLDFEAPAPATKTGNTQAAIAFCRAMEKAGYFTGIYASDVSGFRQRLNSTQLLSFTWWVARYGSVPTNATRNMTMWQYSSSGSVSGITGRVDMNHCYRDFPAIIKKSGLNGYAVEKDPEIDYEAEIEKLNQKIHNLNDKINAAKEALQ